MRLIIASTNPVKVQSALHGFRLMFPDETFTPEGISVPSGVSDQPMTDEETLQGAFNRASNIRERHPDANYWIGIEGGCEEKHGELWTFAWVVVQSSLPRLRGRVREGVNETGGEVDSLPRLQAGGLLSDRQEADMSKEGLDSLPRLRGRVRGRVNGMEGGELLTGKARTGAFMLPQEVATLVRSGVELGHADDQVFGRSNSKQTNGAVGLLTADLIDRQRYYEHAVVLALIPFKNTALTWTSSDHPNL